MLCNAYCQLTGWTLDIHPCTSGQGTEALLTIPPRTDFDASPVLRSFTQEDALRAQRRVYPAWRRPTLRFRQNLLDNFPKTRYSNEVTGLLS